VIIALRICTTVALSQDRPVLVWSFDDKANLDWQYGEVERKRTIKEVVTQTDFEIAGLAALVPGVSGTAMKFDGFSTYVQGVPIPPRKDGTNEGGRQNFSVPRSFTVEAWIALAAYPWNWTPILTIGHHKITGFYFGIDSRGQLGFHVSDATSVWHECNSSIDPVTKVGLKLRTWHHVAGTYTPEDGLKVYIDGALAGTYDDFQFDYGVVYGDDRSFRIGQSRVDLPPTEPIRDWATYPSRYSLDGLVDELKLHDGALSSHEITAIYQRFNSRAKPQLSERKFPVVKSSGRFGANYTRLSYYPEWDALWPPGEHMDVVVQFDQYPTKLLFWRGTRYSPCWVSENGKWMADQSRETSNNWFLAKGSRDAMPTGCIEHMSDTQCRSSRVAIIENNDARCVVNWRYLPMDVRFRQQDTPNNTGFGQWANEYYFIYPDGLCVRKVMPGYGGWQETIFLNEPGTRPEDNVELEACTLVNLDGESKTYSWENGYPRFDLKTPVIQMTNFKSKFKPFMILREGAEFRVFGGEVRPEYSHFPWWNHWPVSQIISDGRSANATDHASHSSLSNSDPPGDAALYGMTDRSAKTLISLARSWISPPEMHIDGTAYQNGGYDYSQRAYVIRRMQSHDPVEIEFVASSDSPLCNVALVIENWGGGEPSLELQGETVLRGSDFRFGVEHDVEGSSRLIVFVACRSEQKIHVRLSQRQR
jgi:hypothetical protein